MNKYRILYLLFLSFLVSCKKDPCPTPTPAEVSKITINPTYLGSSLYLDSVYTAPNGFKLKITDIKFFVTSLGNQATPLSEAALFDFRETGNLLLSAEKLHTSFPSLSGFLGVDPQLNHDDPSAFPNSNPLNISNSGPMHWGWNTGYIFINVEGKADTLVDGVNNLDLSFSYHVGTDAFIENLTFNNINWVKTAEHEHTFALNLDLHQFLFNPLQPIQINTEYFTHSGSGFQALTQKVLDNFKLALTPQ